jgi:hypothetical protein
MAAMSKDEEARCDLVQKYLLEKGCLHFPGRGALCVEGVMRDGAWPFRIVRIDSTGKPAAAGSGAFDIKRWSFSVQALPQPEGGTTVASIPDFTIPSSEIEKIRSDRSQWTSGMPYEHGTAAAMWVLATKGWMWKDESFTCIWFETSSQEGWMTFHHVTSGQGLQGLLVSSYGRINLKDNSVEFSTAGGLD